MKKIVFLIILGLMVAGCSKKVLINVKKPAQYNVSDIKRVAVLDFNGPGESGRVVAGKFTNKLWRTQYFSVMERQELQKILEEHALQMSGVIDDSTVVEFGRILGVDGLFVGDVTSYSVSEKRGSDRVKEKVWKGEYEKDDKGNFIYEKSSSGKKVKKKKYVEEFVRRSYINQSANVGVSFRLISVKTGEIRAGDSNSRSYSQKYYLHKSKVPPKEGVLENLSDQVLDKFIPLITPYNVRVTKTFEEDNDAIDLGIDFAQKNLWDKARDIWQAEIQKDPANSAAHYNLGIAYEVFGELDKAEQHYDQALSIEPKELYMEALSGIRQRKVEQQKLMEQLH